NGRGLGTSCHWSGRRGFGQCLPWVLVEI
ncbi:uncharacterized protein METZ01_LOCUS203971, partial [marine metagenome]